jgi:HEAT repeat protein
VVATLLAALRDRDESGRRLAVRALGPAAPGDNEVVGALLAALKDDSPFASFVRIAAVQALGMAAPGDNAVTAALLTALKDEDAYVPIRGGRKAVDRGVC